MPQAMTHEMVKSKIFACTDPSFEPEAEMAICQNPQCLTPFTPDPCDAEPDFCEDCERTLPDIEKANIRYWVRHWTEAIQ